MVLRFFLFAVAFLFMSCGYDRNNPDDPGSKNYVQQPQPIVPSSSSLVLLSSSSVVPSSSSVALPSSSSVVPIVPSSSSAALPSSSSVPSSSSAPTQTITYGPSVLYDGETYQTVVIGSQTWFKRNLNYAVAGSKCGNGSSLSDANTSTCDTYGRLYDWATAMALPSKCNTSTCQVSGKHQGICPPGWHIPRDAEWTTLIDYVGGVSKAGTKLKSASGWNSDSGVRGTDNYGFAALPGGEGSSYDGSFGGVGSYGSWWSATENYASDVAYRLIMAYDSEGAGSIISKYVNFFSVRCLQDLPSSVIPSSSSVPSSSSSITYTLACSGLPTSGTVGTPITQPTVTCNGSDNTSTLANPTWTDAPTWANPTAGTYNVSATAACGGSSKTASCGTLTIASVLACASVPTSGTAGTAITPPTVTCNGTTISSLYWTGAPVWANPAAGTYSSIYVSASYGNCNGKSASCSGTLTVSAVQTGVIPGPSVPYEGESYETVVIGTQTWVARNLNYNAEGSKCYGEDGYLYNKSYNKVILSDVEIQANCETYGRLYDWATAMNLPSGCNPSSCSGQVNSKHRGICPGGWHIPSNADWNVLMKFINPSCSDNKDCAGAGTKLKSSSGWNLYSGVPDGTDNYGFATLPGGGSFSGGSFTNVGDYGGWWSATEYRTSDGNVKAAYSRDMRYNDERAFLSINDKSNLFSIRCLQD